MTEEKESDKNQIIIIIFFLFTFTLKKNCKSKIPNMHENTLEWI